VSYLQHYCYTESHRHTTGQVSSAPTNSPFCKPSLSKAFSCGGGNELFPETFRGFLQHCKLWSGVVFLIVVVVVCRLTDLLDLSKACWRVIINENLPQARTSLDEHHALVLDNISE
jgi:hypothetical protein